MRRPLSLSIRLSLLFSVTAVGIFIAFGWMISRSTEAHFAAEDTRELEIIAAAVMGALSEVSTEADLARLEHRFEDLLVGYNSASLFIHEQAIGDIYTSPGTDLSAFVDASGPELGYGRVYRWKDNGHNFRLLLQTIDSDGSRQLRFTIAVAVPIDSHLRFLDAFRRTLWLMIIGSIALMSLMGWVAARLGHAPLRAVVDRIRQISINKLDNRLSAQSLPRELTDLAVSFNDMLQRVDDAFQRLSEFSADIAHELRTPVTIMMTQAQVALTRSRSVEEYREILYSNIEEYERMAQMIGDMLFMAKADHGLVPDEITEVNVETEVRDLFDYYDGWAEERGVDLTLVGNANATGDRSMLRRAISNLLSNAIRHTAQGGAVRVALKTFHNGDASIHIDNPGSEIPSAHLPRLFDRFHRVDPSRQRDGDGAGLGLAIVKAIVSAHNGTIQVVSDRGITSFQISLPGP